MKGHWEFNSIDPSSVRQEVTQRDQFNNDEVGLAEALVREVIQNSSDARSGSEPVKVRFSLKTVSGAEAAQLRVLLDPLRPHLVASGVDTAPVGAATSRLLAIEDFNTWGLTGRFDDVDSENFDRFWRAVGESGKGGKAGGRWGLGKLVYSSASKLHAFFGLTMRAGDNGPAVMGQAVLRYHRIGDHFHPAHGFWFGDRSSPPLALQQPVSDPETIAAFSQLGGTTRTNQSGLSLVIPHLVDSVDEDSLISGVVQNYYFPILAGRLVVEIGDVVISRDTFLDVAQTHDQASRVPFGFVKEISDTVEQVPPIVAQRSIGNSELDEAAFRPEDIAAMKALFAAGDLVRARIPVTLKPKDRGDTESFVDLYLRPLPEGASPFALIARGPITLPGERRHFGASAAYGAMIANDDDVAEFLGDAENPAHTAWNPKAEKLAPKWRSPQGTLAAIRHALRQFYSIVADQAEVQDSEALLDFFSIVDKAQAWRGKKKKTSKIKIDVPKVEKAITIRQRAGGFDVIAGPGAQTWEFPKAIRVRMAYDMIGANPFKRHSRFDFDLEKGREISIEAQDAEYEAISPYILKVTASGPQFRLGISGFDERRDIVVDARTA